MFRSIAQDDVKDGVSIYDDQFADHLDQYGSTYLNEYLEYASETIGNAEVDAFELHDEKAYLDCGDAFGIANNLLFPAEEDEAHAAGFNDALALMYHDIIEDGVDEVVRHLGQDIDTGFLPDTQERPETWQEIDSDPRWEDVLGALTLKADLLDISREYASEKRDFYRDHTILKEAQEIGKEVLDLHEPLRQKYLKSGKPSLQPVKKEMTSYLSNQLKERMVTHAQASQDILYGSLVDDESLLAYARDNYVQAIQAHDAHTTEAQKANRHRRKDLNHRVLNRLVTEMYDDDLVKGPAPLPPLPDRYQTSGDQG